jgi:hypothetical protein
MAAALLGDDAVGPLDQAHKNCGIPKFCSPLIQIRFRDPTGPAAGSSSKNGNVFGHYFFKRFAERRPTNGHDRIHRRLPHQIGGFSGKKNLHLVAGIGERESRKGNDALVGSSEPQALFIMILRVFFFGSSV